MTARADVMVVGSINVDFVVRAERLPQAGETVTGGVFETHFGGKGANAAVAAARLGAHVRMIGAVGDDDLGRAALADLSAEGIDVSAVATVPGVATGVALIMVDASGENQIAVASGANVELSGAAVSRALANLMPASGTVVLVGFEVGDDAVLAAAEFAGQHGIRIVVNVGPARPLPAGLAETHPIVVANELEAEALTGQTEPAVAALALAAITGAPAIVTLGEAGAVVVEGTSSTSIPAPRVQAIDATGAGDAFIGALAAELAGGVGLLDAARFATTAASLSVTTAGARGGMPRRVAVEAVRST